VYLSVNYRGRTTTTTLAIILLAAPWPVFPWAKSYSLKTITTYTYVHRSLTSVPYRRTLLGEYRDRYAESSNIDDIRLSSNRRIVMWSCWRTVTGLWEAPLLIWIVLIDSTCCYCVRRETDRPVSRTPPRRFRGKDKCLLLKRLTTPGWRRITVFTAWTISATAPPSRALAAYKAGLTRPRPTRYGLSLRVS
jgi:hypothetical protein